MIFLKTEDEIELLRKSNLLVGKTLAEIAKVIKPGVTTKELDRVAEEFIRDNFKSSSGCFSFSMVRFQPLKVFRINMAILFQLLFVHL